MRTAAYAAGDPLAKYPRMMNPHLHPELAVGEMSRKFLLDPRLYGLLQHFLRDEPLGVQSMVYFKPPGADADRLFTRIIFICA